jgi:hypothetical protein
MISQAAPLRNVGLLFFEATALQNAVSLDWETATELQTAGFIVKRSVNGGEFISLPDIGVPGFIDAAGNPAGFIIAMGGPAEGGTYQEMDNDVQAGNSYTYKLVEVENDNNEVELDMQSVTFGSSSTNTPTTQPPATNSSTSTATATSLVLPNNTLPPTATFTPTALATQPTNNAPANVTATPTAPALPLPLPTVAPNTQTETVLAVNQNGDEGFNSPSTNNVALAQAQATETAAAPTPLPETTNDNGAYPGIQTQVEPTLILDTPIPLPLETTAYPAPTQPLGQNEAGQTAVPVVGSQTNGQTEGNLADLSQETSGRNSQLGRIYLWVGFLLALLIFIMAVVATILLFTRKRTQ